MGRILKIPLRPPFVKGEVENLVARDERNSTRTCCPPLEKEGGGGLQIGLCKIPLFRTTQSCCVRKSRAAIHGRPLGALRLAPLYKGGWQQGNAVMTRVEFFEAKGGYP